MLRAGASLPGTRDRMRLACCDRSNRKFSSKGDVHIVDLSKKKLVKNRKKKFQFLQQYPFTSISFCSPSERGDPKVPPKSFHNRFDVCRFVKLIQKKITDLLLYFGPYFRL